MIIVLSGPIASGKSTLARALAARGYALLKTRDLLAGTTRAELQQAGADLDARDPTWLARAVGDVINPIVVDAARVGSHVDQLAEVDSVLHVHLTAPIEERKQRYLARGGSGLEFEAAARDPIEAAVGQLERYRTDLVLRTDVLSSDDCLAATLGTVEDEVGSSRCVDVLVGAQYGSEGKGRIVAHIAPDYKLLVRVGGPNAGHTVYLGERKAVFKSLPSGALHAPDARLAIGPGAVVRVDTLLHEIKDFVSDPRRVSIDPQAVIIEDSDIDVESDGLVDRVGSTAQGVGRAAARRINDRGGAIRLARDVDVLRPFLKPLGELLESAYARGEKVLLEGTQGTGLSLYHGPYPFTTSRDTSASGTASEAGVAPRRIGKVFMVVRTLPIRVAGNSGPMARELTWEQVADRARVPADALRERERTTTTHRLRRVAELDLAQLRVAARLNAPTDVAITFLDYADPAAAEARTWADLSARARDVVAWVQAACSAPVTLATARPDGVVLDRR